MRTEKVKRIIKEELSAVLKESYGRYRGFGNERGFTSGRYTSDYPRGGEDERGGYESEISYTLRWGLDFPDVGPKPRRSHRFQSLNFGEMEGGDWRAARARYIGEEFANKRATLRAWKETDPEWAEWYLENQEKYEQKDPSVDSEFKEWYSDWLRRIRESKAKKGV